MIKRGNPRGYCIFPDILLYLHVPLPAKCHKSWSRESWEGPVELMQPQTPAQAMPSKIKLHRPRPDIEASLVKEAA